MPTLWLPPKVWFHGSQSTSTGGVSPRLGKHCRIICWLLHSIRWVLITPFGSLVEPEVNRNFAIVSGPTCACAASTAAVGAVASSSSNGRLARPSSAPRASTTSQSAGTAAAIARAVRRAVRREHQPRRQHAEDVAQLAVVLRQQRIGRRDRRVRHAGEHRAEAEQQVLEVVVGQDRERPLGREPAVEQRLRDRARALQRLGIADVAPVAVLRAALPALRDQACAPARPRPSAAAGRSGAADTAAAARSRRTSVVPSARGVKTRCERAAERHVAVAHAGCRRTHVLPTFAGLAGEEGAHAALRGVVALRDRGHQRFGEAGPRSALMSAMRGSACITRSSTAARSPRPCRPARARSSRPLPAATTYCDRPIARPSSAS